jgi:predicted TIM-barrel fold metal-dependent hydrolase
MSAPAATSDETSGRLNTDWMISVDDHVFEPPTLWIDRLPKKYHDVGPRVERIGNIDTWCYEDTRIPMTGISAIVGRDREDWSMEAINYEDIHPSVWQVGPRVEAMNQAGILVQTPFPQYPRFCGQLFKEAQDKDLALLCVQAWNDFMIDEWAGGAPGRFIPLAMVPLWDATLAAREAERAIAKGARGIIFSENAATLGLPSIHDRFGYWDPLFSVANETGLPICMHIGSSSKLPTTAPDAPVMLTLTLGVINAVATLLDWTFSGQFFRHPNLKIALSEGEIGWMPFIKMWMDRSADRQVWAQNTDFNFDLATGDFSRKPVHHTIVDPDKPPSELFREHVYGCFIDDYVGVRNIDLIGVDNIMMETDFPHSDGSWPDSIEIAKREVASLPVEDQYKLLRGNAERLFQFTPAEPPVAAQLR